MAAATIPPVGWKVSALSTTSERRTSLCQPPSYVLWAIHSAQYASVSSTAWYGVHRFRRPLPGRVPGQHERHPLAGGDGELGVRGQVPPLQRGRRAQPGRVRPGDRDHLVVDPAHPRHHPAVVEAQPQLAVHRHPAGDALDDPDHVRRLVPRRHAVDHPDGALRGLPHRLQHQRVAAVAAPGRGAAGRRGQPPVAVVLGAEQRGEAGRRVEVREAQPVDRAVPADQRRRLQVAEQRVVLDE